MQCRADFSASRHRARSTDSGNNSPGTLGSTQRIAQRGLGHVAEVQDTSGVPHLAILGSEPRLYPGLRTTAPTGSFPKPNEPLLLIVQEDSLGITEEFLDARRSNIRAVIIIHDQLKITTRERDRFGFPAFPVHAH